MRRSFEFIALLLSIIALAGCDNAPGSSIVITKYVSQEKDSDMRYCLEHAETENSKTFKTADGRIWLSGTGVLTCEIDAEGKPISVWTPQSQATASHRFVFGGSKAMNVFEANPDMAEAQK